MYDNFIILASWLIPNYLVVLAVGLAITHLVTRSRPTAGRLLIWITAPPFAWCVAVFASGRFVGFFNIFVEPPLLAAMTLIAYWWPLYWRSAEDKQNSRRDVGVLIAVNGLALLMGLLFPNLGESP